MHICYCKLFIDVLQQNVIYCALVIEHAHVWYAIYPLLECKRYTQYAPASKDMLQ